MADPASRDLVELTVGGRIHRGWTAVSIELSLDALAASFSLTLAERGGGDPDAFELTAGAGCGVAIGGETVVTGWIDALEASLTGDDHAITVTGRSMAADLIDCSAVAKPGKWSGRKLEAIAAELAQPFGITVVADVDTGAAFKSFALQQGETVLEVIERMGRMRGVLAVSDPDGTVHVVSGKPTGAAVRLRQGFELLSVQGKHDVADRFSAYVVKGQSAGDDQVNGRAASQVRAEAKDPGITRYRPLLIVAEDQADVAAARKRANWEATVRQAKAQEATVSLVGWRRPDGKLWRPRDAVSLDAPAAWMTDDLMAAGVTFAIGEGGTTATLRCVRPEAYSQEPVSEKAEASRVRKPGAKAKPAAKPRTPAK